jgi:hypothetical protein
MFFLSFLGIMDKFIIINVHDAILKTRRNNLKKFPHFTLLVYEKKYMLEKSD